MDTCRPLNVFSFFWSLFEDLELCLVSSEPHRDSLWWPQVSGAVFFLFLVGFVATLLLKRSLQQFDLFSVRLLFYGFSLLCFGKRSALVDQDSSVIAGFLWMNKLNLKTSSVSNCTSFSLILSHVSFLWHINVETMRSYWSCSVSVCLCL